MARIARTGEPGGQRSLAGVRDGTDTIIVIADGRALERSDAALAIASRLPFPWPMFGVLRILPRPLRDRLYRLVARNRYRWFGKSDTCMMPTPELRARFLE